MLSCPLSFTFCKSFFGIGGFGRYCAQRCDCALRIAIGLSACLSHAHASIPLRTCVARVIAAQCRPVRVPNWCGSALGITGRRTRACTAAVSRPPQPRALARPHGGSIRDNKIRLLGFTCYACLSYLILSYLCKAARRASRQLFPCVCVYEIFVRSFLPSSDAARAGSVPPIPPPCRAKRPGRQCSSTDSSSCSATP